MNEWMDGWIGCWMDGWMDHWMDGQILWLTRHVSLFSTTKFRMTFLESGICMNVPFNRVAIKSAVDFEEFDTIDGEHTADFAGVSLRTSLI